MLESLVARSLRGFIRFLTGARVLREATPGSTRRVYYGNHSSHGDFVLIWAALPASLRQTARPVAAADYWRKGWLRRYLIHRVFHGVLIERHAATRQNDPIALMQDALDAGQALILFPEGTRHKGNDVLPFKTGIYHLAQRCPDIEFVPVWLENLNRVMPKGKVLPLPLLCTVCFGQPLQLEDDETKQDFLARTRHALLALAGKGDD